MNQLLHERQTNPMPWIAVAALVFTILMLGTTARAGAQTSAQDRAFAAQAAQDAQAALRLAKMGEDRASRPAIRELAEAMVQAFGGAGSRLRIVAFEDAIALPAQTTPREQAAYQAVGTTPRSEFDMAFLARAQRLIRSNAQLARTESTNGDDRRLRGFASWEAAQLQAIMAQSEAAA